jgi:hypothetical protein
LSRLNFASRFLWIAGSTSRSLVRNGLPLISFIIPKVIRITSRITGTVHATLLRMSLSTSGEARCPPLHASTVTSAA